MAETNKVLHERSRGEQIKSGADQAIDAVEDALMAMEPANEIPGLRDES